jgi:hypothetical protein
MLFVTDVPQQNKITNPLIQIVIEEKVEQPPQPTAQEILDKRIKENVNKCNESTHWISAEDASCLPKRISSPVTTQSTARTAVRGSKAPAGYYDWGWCTYGAQQLAPWVGGWSHAQSLLIMAAITATLE